MRGKKVSTGWKLALSIFALTLSFAQSWAATSKVIHHFNSNQGANPEGVTIGPDGNLYGTTIAGGGTVFQLTRGPAGRWLETKVYDVLDVAVYPNGGLIFDAAGNIYVTTQQGLGGVGVCGCCYCGAFGDVVELSPIPGGHGWHATVIVDFYSNGFDRKAPADTIFDGNIMFPISGLTRDAAGNLYGVAVGADGLIDSQVVGALYKLSPSPGGGWTLADGPYGEGATSGPVVIDANGNLYGVSGAFNGPLGSVWKVDSTGVLTTLYTFELSKNGNNPIAQGGLVLDSAGNLYGTTQSGGQFDKGTVFELSPGTDGTWSEKVLYNFNSTNGGHPQAGVILDAGGNLYGEAFDGGDGGAGVVFELKREPYGGWKYIPLRSFHGPDGNGPSFGLVFDTGGNLYGTTWQGGAYGNGTVFEITP